MLSSLSLRGPEGAVAISGRQLRFRRWLSHDTVEYCEIAPQGHFLALRAQGATAPLGPRNDKPLAFAILTAACFLRRCSAGRGMPLPYKACAVGDHATKPTACKALSERRYRRNRCRPFYRLPVRIGSIAPSNGQMSFSAEKTGRFSGKKFQKALAFRVFQCYNKDNLQ